MLSNLFKALISEGINYAVLRNYENLPDDCGNDLDILIPHYEVENFIKIVGQNGKIVQVRKNYKYYGITVVFEDYGILLIDLFTSLRYLWIDLVDVERVLKSKSIVNDIYVLKGDVFYAGLLPKVVQDYRSTELKYFNNDSNINWKEIIDTYCVLPTNSIKKNFRLKHSTYLKISVFKYIFKRLCYLIQGRTNRLRFFVLIGPDGIGKTTISNEMSFSLMKNGFYKNVIVKHHRPELLPNLSSYLTVSKKTISSNNNVVNNFNIIDFIKLLYYTLDYLFVYFELLYCYFTNSILIYDRYVYDYSVQKHYGKHPKILINLLYFILPKPDKIIFIYSYPKEVVNRKNEQTLGDHQIQNNNCIELLKKNRKIALPIHTSSDKKSTLKKILWGLY